MVQSKDPFNLRLVKISEFKSRIPHFLRESQEEPLYLTVHGEIVAMLTGKALIKEIR